MLNTITIMGRLTRDPELRRTGSGKAVANFSVAVDRDYSRDPGKKETDFIDCVAWGSTAEFVNSYIGKGSLVAVHGRLQLRDWTDRNGTKHRAAEVVAEGVYFGESKRRSGEPSAPPPAMPAYPEPMPVYPDPMEPYAALADDDEGLPF